MQWSPGCSLLGRQKTGFAFLPLKAQSYVINISAFPSSCLPAFYRKPLQKPTANQNSRVVESRLNGYIYKTLLFLKFRERLGTWGRKMVRAWESRSWLWDYLLVKSEATVIEPHQHGCLNTSWTRMTTICIHSGSDDRKLRGLYPNNKLYTSKECREREQ